jgi:two-component system, OmpR family, phosphate regulon sensor histidine kinase PhoR
MELNSKNAVIQADPIHLTNVIYNLLDNALKYSADAPSILILTRDFEGQLSIIVRDNGIGISKEDQKRIFEKLYRVPTGNLHNVKGFGLGLSYVKAIVEKHGGSIHVESVPDKGSSFEIRLPKNQDGRQQN